ncbi:MAG: c-type cytochrome [Gammaproteobacteria bacterium]|nr:MAG: c-type cytochrome [Gammaproteobacteria bacterium]
MKTFLWSLVFLLSLAAGGVGADGSELLMRRANRFFEVLPESMPGSENDTQARIVLGRKLFFDKRLSINDSQACVSCHKLEDGFAGVDNLPTSPGARGEIGTRNSPTVLNAGWQVAQFWDGRADDLVEQAKQPILNPIEMGMPDEDTVVHKIRGIDEYREDFAAAFPGQEPAVTYQNIAEAIAAFERTLITPSRFDDFLDGDATALSEAEQRGLNTFLRLDCNSCHDGVLLGGETFEPLGKENPYENQADQGQFEVTGRIEDKMFFKVSPLRNVALTAPYFHDGKIATLDEAIRQMGKLQLNEDLDEQQVSDIASFLKALTDKQRERYLQ